MAYLLIDIKNMCKKAKRIRGFSPTRINILNKCDKKVLCVYIGPREIVYQRLPAVAKEGPGSLIVFVLRFIMISMASCILSSSLWCIFIIFILVQILRFPASLRIINYYVILLYFHY
jgi:hypothetical protein